MAVEPPKLHWRARPVANTPKICRLIEDNLGLAHSAARRTCREHDPRFEDVLSAAMNQLWRCAAKFDPGRGFAFSTYAYKCCLLAARRGLHSRQSIETRSLEVKLHSPGGGSVLDSIAEAEHRAGLLDWIGGELKRLKPRDRDIVWDRFAVGKTLEQIGFEHGLTRERVRQICITALDEMTERYQAMADSEE